VLFRILLEAFDLRRQIFERALQDKYDANERLIIEQTISETAISLIMKLNDATFRPFFSKFVDWATKQLPKSDKYGRLNRQISLYRFLERFFDKLKVSVLKGSLKTMLTYFLLCSLW
jgi:U3 small nucleolar RNA-associated protein 10